MKKFLSVLLPMVMLITMASCSKSDDSSSDSADNSSVSESTVESVEGFHVDGTKLLDANGNEFVMRGVNHAHTWFKDSSPIALKAIAETGSNAVRIVLSDGQQWDKDDLESIKSLIDQCKELKMIAILEVHDATGDNNNETLDAAVNYWIEMKDALIGQESYVILNIANEWYGLWNTAEPWRDGYKNAIPQLREAGIKNTIMVDSAGWGQYPKSVIDHGKDVFESDPLKNTMFSVHFYGSAGGSADKIKSTLDSITELGLCVCAGEFGYTHTDGDVDEEYLMKYCTEQNIGYLGWSWKGNGGGVEYLDIAEDWTGQKLSADWGENLVNGDYGIKKTSKVCSVFES